eukprot:gene4905-9786_t
MLHTKHIALEKTRITLNLLRKSNLCLESNNQESPIISQLKALQQRLRSSETEFVDAIEVISPFVAVLRAPYLAGPYKSAALDAIQTFISCNILSESPNKTGDALAEVVDAVTRCKFVQTDVNADDLVRLRIIQVLQAITCSPVRVFLTDETAWDIVEACYAILLQAGFYKPALYQVAEQTLLDAVHFIFSCVPDESLLSPSPHIRSSTSTSVTGTGSVTDHPHHHAHAHVHHAPPPPRASFGLPCAMKVLGYFVNIVQKHSADTSHSTRQAMNGYGQGSGGGSSSNSSSSNRQYGRPSLSRGQSPLIDAELDMDSLELHLALKTIHAMLTGQGNLNVPRDLIL